MASQRLTFYLLRDGIADFKDALDYDKTSTKVPVDPTSGIDGCFYYVPRRLSIPKWVKFVRPILSAEPQDMDSASTSGLLLLKVNGRIFALTFGYGRSLLDLSKIEFQFGLRVALNRIDPSQLRSLETKTFDDIVVATNTQASKSAELPIFGIDVSGDILRAATGEPRDNSTVKRLSGSDALVLNVDVEPTNLPSLCADLLLAFGEQNYKSDFGWIDQLALVRDDSLVATLDCLLVKDLVAGNTATTHLAMPENVNWEDIDNFKITGTRDYEYDDLDLDAYLTHLGGRRATITLEILKSRRVSVGYSRTGNYDSRWPLYRCIVTEQRVDENLYVLIEGRWFAVSGSLVAEVDRFVTGLPPASFAFMPANVGETEPAYNGRLAASSPSDLLKLDARIKRPGGAASGIELCDLLSKEGELIHIKRRSRASTLSHLFAQGSVSATTLANDGHFRDEIRKVICKIAPTTELGNWLDLVPASDEIVDRSRYCVTFAVVANSQRAGNDWLPFFSKLNLMQHGRQLRNSGFKVAISRIEIR